MNPAEAEALFAEMAQALRDVQDSYMDDGCEDCGTIGADVKSRVDVLVDKLISFPEPDMAEWAKQNLPTADAMKAWISSQLAEARKHESDAEEARAKSDYTDIDALEQACYMRGFISVLKDMRKQLDPK